MPGSSKWSPSFPFPHQNHECTSLLFNIPHAPTCTSTKYHLVRCIYPEAPHYALHYSFQLLNICTLFMNTLNTSQYENNCSHITLHLITHHLKHPETETSNVKFVQNSLNTGRRTLGTFNFEFWACTAKINKMAVIIPLCFQPPAIILHQRGTRHATGYTTHRLLLHTTPVNCSAFVFYLWSSRFTVYDI
jgi:hypothetical protein